MLTLEYFILITDTIPFLKAIKFQRFSIKMNRKMRKNKLSLEKKIKKKHPKKRGHDKIKRDREKRKRV